jgi:hypothetical protein
MASSQTTCAVVGLGILHASADDILVVAQGKFCSLWNTFLFLVQIRTFRGREEGSATLGVFRIEDRAYHLPMSKICLALPADRMKADAALRGVPEDEEEEEDEEEQGEDEEKGGEDDEGEGYSE